ncbi:MAG: RICIN domain-containing protein [Alloprevotella sp.]|nr:RICIN domain-containing protein [Alloprevotella sp.]
MGIHIYYIYTRARELAVLLALFLAACSAVAQDIATLLPGKFVRIRTLDELTEDGFYLIGSYGVKRNNFYLLSNTARSNKLAAMYIDGAQTDILENERAARVWRIVRDEDGTVILQSAATGESVNAGTKKKTDNDNTNLCTSDRFHSTWEVSVHDGVFNFANAGSDRFLCISENATTDSYFGNYIHNENEPPDLYIFKLITKFGQLTGEAAVPANGSKVAIAAGDFIAGNSFMAEDAASHLLCDGTIAPAEGLIPLTATTDATGRFSLRDSNGKYLDYALQFSESPASWAVSNGYVITTEVTPRYLVLLPSEGRFALLTQDEANTAAVLGVTFRQVGEEPAQEMINGVLTLTGAWDARRLAALNLAEADALDLSGISLPLHPLTFEALPADKNFPIYTKAEDAEAVPDTWPFVISGDKLLRNAVLADRAPLRIPKPFSVETNQLTYEREMKADGMWETLFLPFATSVPQGFHAELLKTYSSNALTFEPVTEIPANTPAIIRYTGSTNEEAVELRLHSKQGYVMTNASSIPYFYGTYQPLTVNSAAENIYLLNEAGDTFVHADAGSRLAPFRSYLKVSGAQMYLPLPVTAIREITTSTEKDGERAYTLDGRRATNTPQRGVLIIGNKKIINH